MGYNCCFSLNFVPLHIESPYNFGGTGPILGVKNPLQRVNGHAAKDYRIDICCFSAMNRVLRNKRKDWFTWNLGILSDLRTYLQGKCSNAFFSETTNMIKAKLYMNVHWMVLYNLKG
jgi:hypothetical protein